MYCTEWLLTYRNGLNLCQSFSDLLKILLRCNGLEIIVHYSPARHMDVKCYKNVSFPYKTHNLTTGVALQKPNWSTIIDQGIFNRLKQPILVIHMKNIFLHKHCNWHWNTCHCENLKTIWYFTLQVQNESHSDR